MSSALRSLSRACARALRARRCDAIDASRARASTASFATSTGAGGDDEGGAAADDAVTLTPACAARLRDVAREEGVDAVALRLAVEGGGCSGFKYTFTLETGKEKGRGDDLVFTSADGGATLVVDEISYGFVKGSTIDYVEEMIKSSFEVVKNPQADASCGCGASFNAKDALFS